MKKKIVYLFGTGATHAEINFAGLSTGILMSNIREGILKKIDKKKIKVLYDVKNELVNDNSDIEHLISLYKKSGNATHSSISNKLRELFREEIQEKIQELDSTEGADNGSYIPKLYSALIDMHMIEDFDEELIGLLTLNYEDLIERSAQNIVNGVNYIININETKNSNLKIDKKQIPILKLHGSFNWKREFPISVNDVIKNNKDVLWIPPGVEKERTEYPFNILWGKAQELLDCDILRIIGCSLNRNDWHLVSLLYITQKLNTNKKEFIIELINHIDGCKIIKRNYAYLNIKKIEDIKEIREFAQSSIKTPGDVTETAIIEYIDGYKNKFDM